MRNKILVTVLGIGLGISSVIADYVYTQTLYQQRIDENTTYESLEANPHSEYNGFTIEKIGVGYEKPLLIFNKVVLDIPIINQYPELPVGCEMVSATAVLNYLGFDIDKIDFTENFMPYDDNFFYDNLNILHGPDPRLVFTGDPYDWGYGCSSEVLAGAMNSYFDSQSSEYTALSLNGNLNSADIEKLLNEGVPIIVWATVEMKPFNYRKPSEWIIDATDETFCWYPNSHTIVLCGYDSNCYYFMDCNEKTEITQHLKTKFLTRFEDNGFQAVIVKLNE